MTTLAAIDLKPGEAHGVLGLCLRDHLAPLGFSLAEGGLQAVVFRQHGSIRQAITLHATGEGGQVGVRLALWFSSALVSSVWVRALPHEFAAWKARSDTACGGVSWDFAYGLTDLVRSATSEEIELFGGVLLGSEHELQEFAQQLCGFCSGKLLPVLDGIKDLPSLAKQVITDQNVHILRYGNVSLLEQLGTAVLARLVKSSRFEEIAEALLGNPRKAEFWQAFQDRDGRHIEGLIQYLRALPLR